MPDTGLTFSADGSGDYIKIIKTITDVQKKIDKSFKASAKSGDEFADSLDRQNKSITSSSRRLNTLIDKLGELSSEISDIKTQLPRLFKDIESGFTSSKIARTFSALGEEIGDKFIEGIEGSLGIRSPSRVMRQIGDMVYKGFEGGTDSRKFKKLGDGAANNFINGFKSIGSGIKSIMDSAVNTVRQGIQTINRELKNAGQGLKDLGSNLMTTGGGLLAAGGLVAGLTAGGAGFAVNEFATFEDSLINSQSILGATNDEMAILQQQLLQIGGDSTVGVFSTADAFYSIVSGVQDASTHMDILNSAIATSEAGQAELTATTSGLISVMNSYGSETISAAQASDVFSRTVQMGVGTMDGFVSAMSPIAGLSSSVGVSFDELGTAMAFLTAQGATTGAAATRLQSSMVALLRPNTRMAEALQQAGYESGQAAIEQLGLVGALDAVNTSLDGNTAQFAEALGSVEALQGAVSLLDDGYSDFADRYAEGLDGATDAAREIQLQRTNAALDNLRSSFSAMTIEIGSHLAPTVVTLANALTMVIDGVRDFMQNNQRLVGILIRVVTVGGLVIGGLLAIAGAVAVVTGAMAFLSGSAIFGVVGAIGGLVTVLFSPVGLITGLAGVVAYFTILPAIMSTVTSSLSRVGAMMSRVGAGINAVIGANTSGQSNEAAIARENELLERRASIIEGIEDSNAEITTQQTIQIEAGDTLWDLSQQYGVSVEALREANQIEGSMLSIGQELIIPIDVQTGSSVADLNSLRLQLSNIDTELATLDTSPPTFDQLQTNFSALVTSAGLVADGLVSMTTGDITGGLLMVETGIDGVKDAVSGLWSTFTEGFNAAGPTTNITDETMLGSIEDSGTTNPIVDRINQMITDATGYDFSTQLTSLTDNLSSSISGSLTAIEGHDFTSIEQSIADNLDTIVAGAVTIFGMVIGFPVGTALGLANMIGTAISNDVGGIGTWLEDNGVLTDAENVFTEVGSHIQNAAAMAFDTIFGGGGTTVTDGVIDTSQMITVDTGSGNPLQPLLDWFDPITTSLTAAKDTIIDTLPLIQDGISGFITGLSSTVDVGQLSEAAGNIGGGIMNVATFIRDLLSPFIEIATVGGAGLITGISEALPDLGETLGNLINSVSALLTGDFGGAWTSFVDGILSFGSAIASFTVGAADGVVTALQNISGIDLPNFDESIAAWQGAFSNGWLALQIIINNIRAGIGEFVLDLRLRITEMVAGIRQTALDLSFGQMDIAPNIETEFNLLNAEQQLRDAIQLGDTAGASEAITMGTELGLDVTGVTMQYQGTEGFEAIRETIGLEMAEAASEGDEEGVDILVPMAVGFGLSDDDVLTQANEAGLSVGDEMRIGLNAALGIASPSQIAVDAGTSVVDGFVLGMQLNLFKMSIPLTQMVFYLNQVVVTTQQMGLLMGPVQAEITRGFKQMADSAKGLWTFLRSIKIMMEEIGLSPGDATAMVAAGGGDAAAIVQTALGGGRAEGGDLQASKFYEINEGGIPEVGVIGGRTYLFPAGDGYMSPATPMNASNVMGSPATTNNVGGNSISIGSITLVIPDNIDSPQQMSDWFLDAIESYGERRPVSDGLRDSI